MTNRVFETHELNYRPLYEEEEEILRGERVEAVMQIAEQKALIKIATQTKKGEKTVQTQVSFIIPFWKVQQS